MPIVPPNDINDIPRPVRGKLERLFFERAVLQYAFSFSKLEDIIVSLRDDAGLDTDPKYVRDDIQKCIVAWKDDEAKAVKSELNDRITSIYTENGIDKTLRHVDPFGREKDYIMLEGHSASFSQTRALEIATAGVYRWVCPECNATNYTQTDKKVVCPECREAKRSPSAYVTAPKAKLIAFDAEALAAVFALATSHSTYVSLQARDVVESGKGKRR